MKIESRPLADIKPYEKNPRQNDSAVEAVAASIREFGFRQPIVVDAEGLVIVGHTRLKAAQRLGLEEVPVHIAGDLTEEQAALVVQIAKHQNFLFGSTDNFVVTREFNNMASREQKVELLHCLFAVSASDDSISTRENATISQIARELKFRQPELVELRGAYRDKLAVLKNLPG